MSPCGPERQLARRHHMSEIGSKLEVQEFARSDAFDPTETLVRHSTRLRLNSPGPFESARLNRYVAISRA